MTKNPLLNAFLAIGYIALVALLMYLVPLYAPRMGALIAIMSFVSLFVFSAAVMGYLFLSQPLMLYVDGEKKQAVRLFLMTVISFALVVGLFLVSAFIYGSFFTKMPDVILAANF